MNKYPKITVFNSFSNQFEEFIPFNDTNIGMYVCGPTVYDKIHLGNARPLVFYDFLYRFLSLYYDGYASINYVRNITDIDDKIITRATEMNIGHVEFAAQMIDIFHQEVE